MSRTEDQHAVAFVEELRRQWPKHAHALVHVANEGAAGSRGAALNRAAKLKRMGQIKGTSDYFLAVATDEFHGLWLELKKPGGRVEPEQVAFLKARAEGGYGAVVAWGWAAAVHATSRYLRGTLPPYVVGALDPADVTEIGRLTQAGTPRKAASNGGAVRP